MYAKIDGFRKNSNLLDIGINSTIMATENFLISDKYNIFVRYLQNV